MPNDPTHDAALAQKLGRAVTEACPGWAEADQARILAAATARVTEARATAGSGAAPKPDYLWRIACAATLEGLHEAAARAGTKGASEDALAGRAVAVALAEQPERRRLATAMWLLGHTIPEVAHLLELAPKRAESTIERGRADLRTRVAALGHEARDDATLRRWFSARPSNASGDAPTDVAALWDALRGETGPRRVVELAGAVVDDPAAALRWRVARVFADRAASDEEETVDAVAVIGPPDEGDDEEAEGRARGGIPRGLVVVALAIVAATALAWWWSS